MWSELQTAPSITFVESVAASMHAVHGLASHGLTFVALSVLVAIAGSWTALDLFRRVRSHFGAARRNWLAAAALALGVSIWSMHFIAMLGFDPGSPVRYDPGLTALSLVLAIGSTGGAFMVAARESADRAVVIAAGTAMGLGICLMHYVGMAALRSAVSLGYDQRWVAASVVVAVVASITALFAAGKERSTAWRAAAAVILGLAIVGMHYTGMAGVRLTPGPAAIEAAAEGAPPFALAIGVAAGACGVLALALLASLYDQRTDVLSALDAGGVGYWELALPSMVLHSSEEAKAILGLPRGRTIGHQGFLDMLSDEDRFTRAQLFERLQQGGTVWDREYRLKDKPVTIAVRGRLTRDGSGRPRRMTGVIFDVTERRRAFDALAESERRQKLLIAELNHRVKNTLATVQSLALHTAKGANSVDAFRAGLEARLVALSRTHDALTRGHWEAVSLRELLDGELKPYAKGQVALDGPELDLTPREALSLGMTIHELATNAAKYGALSTEAGTLTVSWTETPDGALALTWRERGGPPVTVPERRGFGSRLIERSVRHELRGEAVRRFEPEGLTCVIRFPRGPAG